MLAIAMLLAAVPYVADVAPQDAAPANAVREGKRRVLVLDLRNDGVAPEHARLVTDSVVVGLSRFQRLEVISSEDVRRMVQSEGEKQAMGCTDEGCLVELANAIDAQLIVHGSIGKLDTLHIVNLSLFDGKAGKSVKRESVKSSRLEELPNLVEDATERLIAPILGAEPVMASSGANPARNVSVEPDSVSGTTAALTAAGVAGCLGIPLAALSALPCSCLLAAPVGCGLAVGGAAAGYAVSGASFDNFMWPAVISGAAGLVFVTLGAGTGGLIGTLVTRSDPTVSLYAGSAGALVGAGVGMIPAAITTAVVTAVYAGPGES